MDRTQLLSTIFMLGLATAPAFASDATPSNKGFYAEVDGGISLNQKTDLDTGLKNIFPGTYDLSFDNSALVNGAVGYNFGTFRGELELGYTGMDLDEMTVASIKIPALGDMSALTVLANGYWDIPTSTRWTPFIGAGIGVASLSIESPKTAMFQVDESDTVFAYQLSTGTSYRLSDHVSLAASYRYLGTTEGTFRTDIVSPAINGYSDMKARLSAHQFRAGVRYEF